MTIDTFLTSKDSRPPGLFDTDIEPFLRHLRAAGYAERTLRKKRSVATSFARWTRRNQVAVEDLNEYHLTAFAERLPQRQKASVKFELAALRRFLEYLRAEARVPIPSLRIGASPADDLKQRYVNYLRNERGLTENSVRVYSPFICDFLTEQVARTGCASPDALDAMT